jgi:pyrroline-5-carboxylate reductase
MPERMKVGIIGCGNMGSSLLKGMLKSGALKAREVTVSDSNGQRLKSLRNLGVKTTSDNRRLVDDCDVIFIAVKPDIVEPVLKEVGDVSNGKLFISVAAGVSTKYIEARTKGRVIRAMPNICGAVGEMASCFSLGKRATGKDGKTVERLLGGAGATFKVDEKIMNSVTGLSGSGPAYFFYLVQAAAKAGEELGIPREVALSLAAQTMKGAAEMVRSGGSPEALIKKVCTPKGTTIEGMKVLEDRKVAEALKDAIKAAARRAKELSR